MKRFLLGLLVISFTCISTNATYQVNYTNTDIPTNTNYYNFGSNASFTPANASKAGAIKRMRKHEDQYYNGLEKGNTINVNVNTSTNKNTTTSTAPITTPEAAVQTTTTETTPKATPTPAKTNQPYTKNGIIYY